MRTSRASAVLFVLGGVACASCGDAAGHTAAQDLSFPEQPEVVVDGASHVAELEVRTAPSQPPQRGISSVELVVRRANDGALVGGATLEVSLFMPAMGHGSSVKPTIVDEGGGRYLVENVSLPMPGRWQLGVTTHGEGADDETTVTFDVQ